MQFIKSKLPCGSLVRIVKNIRRVASLVTNLRLPAIWNKALIHIKTTGIPSTPYSAKYVVIVDVPDDCNVELNLATSKAY